MAGGRHALHLAVENKNIGVIRSLLECGANPNAEGKYKPDFACNPLELTSHQIRMGTPRFTQYVHGNAMQTSL